MVRRADLPDDMCQGAVPYHRRQPEHGGRHDEMAGRGRHGKQAVAPQHRQQPVINGRRRRGQPVQPRRHIAPAVTGGKFRTDPHPFKPPVLIAGILFGGKPVLTAAGREAQRINIKERPQHIHPGPPQVTAHASEPGKARSTPEPHHHRFGLIAGMMAKKEASALPVHPCQQQIIPRRARPCLQPGHRGRSSHCQDFGLDPAVLHSRTDPRRLGGAVGPDAVINDEGGVAMPVTKGEIGSEKRKGAAVGTA